MQKIICLIMIVEFTAACGGGSSGSSGVRRQVPVGGPPTGTPIPYSGSLRVSASSFTSNAVGVSMRASVSGGNSRAVSSASGVSATMSVGVPASSR